MSRVVVTGGSGFLGSHICEQLLNRGDQVVAIDNLITGNVENISHLFGVAGFSFIQHNVSEFVHVSGPVDAVMHFASPASPKDYLEMPIQTLKVGSLGTLNTLGLAKDKGARYFIASTSEVYGDPQVHPQTEDYWGHVNPVGPRGVYDEAKRFAEAMTMAYHRYHGVDVRIVRIFNSILADEQVLYDDGSELRRERVGDLAARIGSNVDLSGYKVPAFDGAGTIRAREAIALVGHPTENQCFEVRTRYGRSIRVTGDHSLFVEGPHGAPVARPVSQLAIGDRVAIAGRVQVPERDREWLRMTDVIDAQGIDPAMILIRAPGLGSVVWSHRFEVFASIAASRKPESTRWRSVVWGEIARHRDRDQLPLDLVRRLGITIPFDATVRLRTAGRAAELPEFIRLSDELLWVLGLFVAEGCRYESGSKSSLITISCDDETLARAAKIIERELNLHVVGSPASASRGAAIFVHARLLLRALDHLGFDQGEKRIPGWILGLPLRRLKWFIEGYRVGDGVHSGAKLAEGIRHEFSTTSTALKDDLVVAFARFGLVPSAGQYQTTFKQKTGDRRYQFWRLTLAHVFPWSPLDWDRGVQQVLQARRTGDIVWAPVTALIPIDATPLVYDFSVPGAENFWAGSGVMAHNTYGPRMRPNDGRVVSNFITQAIQGKNITVYGDGSQTRSFCYVDDEVRGILALLDSDQTGPMNIGNPDEFTVKQLAEMVIEMTGSSSEIVYEDLPVDDPTQRKPDISLARATLGWEPQVPLREGLRRTIPWFEKTVKGQA